MARGWESKSVEQQQEEMAEQRKSVREKTARALISPSPSPRQQQRNREREGLLLSRGRLTQQLQTASHPRHRQMLEQAIAELDRQLSSFEQVPNPTSPK
jgi:predicted component of type VI protein secretion system